MAECRESHDEGSVLSWEYHITLARRGYCSHEICASIGDSIVLARVGAQVSPVSHYGSEIMAGSMGHYLAVDLGRKSCITNYAHFPVLLGEYGGNINRMLEKYVFPLYTRVWCLWP